MRNAGPVLDVLRDGPAVLSPRSPRRNRWRASCWETSLRGSDRGSLEKDPPLAGTSPAAYRCVVRQASVYRHQHSPQPDRLKRRRTYDTRPCVMRDSCHRRRWPMPAMLSAAAMTKKSNPRATARTCGIMTFAHAKRCRKLQ